MTNETKILRTAGRLLDEGIGRLHYVVVADALKRVVAYYPNSMTLNQAIGFLEAIKQICDDAIESLRIEIK